MTELKNLGCVLNGGGIDVTECHKKVTSGRKVAGAIRSLLNARALQLVCTRVLHEALLMTALLFSSETIWRKGKVLN